MKAEAPSIFSVSNMVERSVTEVYICIASKAVPFELILARNKRNSSGTTGLNY